MLVVLLNNNIIVGNRKTDLYLLLSESIALPVVAVNSGLTIIALSGSIHCQ